MAGKSSEIRRKSFEVVNQKPSADDLRTKMPITLDDRKAADGKKALGVKGRESERFG